MTALAHNCYNESHGQLDNTQPPLCANTTGINGFLYRHPALLEMEWYALMVLTILEAFRKLTSIPTYPSVRQFFTQAENMVEWCVILSVFATSFYLYGQNVCVAKPRRCIRRALRLEQPYANDRTIANIWSIRRDVYQCSSTSIQAFVSVCLSLSRLHRKLLRDFSTFEIV